MPFLRAEERVGTEIVGRYRLERVLGRGGMGTVFAGHHALTGRGVALKMIHPEFDQNEPLVARFIQEARAAASLRHPNVVEVLDVGESDDGAVFLVLELLEGESLGERMERSGALPITDLLEWVLPVLEALECAHRVGILHRDLKPDNIFLSIDGRKRVVPKLLDFGIAKWVDAGGVATRTGTLLGTPHFMSPEQARACPNIGPASDVWSMGVVLFQGLTGQLPFDASSVPALLLQIALGEFKPIRAIAPDVPEAVAAVVERAITPDLARRYRSMTEFSRALIGAALQSNLSLDFDPLSDQIRLPTPAPLQASESRPSLPGQLRSARPARRALLAGALLGVVGLSGLAISMAVSSPNRPARASAAVAELPLESTVESLPSPSDAPLPGGGPAPSLGSGGDDPPVDVPAPPTAVRPVTRASTGQRPARRTRAPAPPSADVAAAVSAPTDFTALAPLPGF